MESETPFLHCEHGFLMACLTVPRPFHTAPGAIYTGVAKTTTVVTPARCLPTAVCGPC